jgi:hypothetical protein
MELPPDFSGRLDFSQFHDLAHPPFTAHCRSSYGGPRHHLYLWWLYIGYPGLRRTTVCRIGRHAWSEGWNRERGHHRLCQDCLTLRDP